MALRLLLHFVRCRSMPTGSGQNLTHHPPVHVSQPEVAAAVAVGEAFVVQAHQVQNRGVQVMDVDALLDGAVAELVGGAVDVAGFRRKCWRCRCSCALPAADRRAAGSGGLIEAA